MDNRDKLIKKYPYLAYSKNIMEYFALIGYQEKYIRKVISGKRYNKEINYPTILFSTTSNTDFGIVDNKLIITQVYPDIPKIIPINKNNMKSEEEEEKTSNTIYSFCYDSLDGKDKLFYICFAYKFYEKYKFFYNKTQYSEFYVPKAFCIISQYYYFTFFEYICKNLHILLKNKDIESIPVEITIYNIVNFIPSPMNYSLNLDLFSCMLASEKEVFIKQLSGYPYLDFDLVKIFNLLPLNFIIEIFILSMIEQSMLFFCSNLEILNMTMFILFVLNYPCNDSPYFWHIVSISKNNFDEDNKFVGKVMTSMLGVNTLYTDDFNTEAFGKFNYIIDIDKKNIILKKELEFSEEDDGRDYEGLNNFRNYIRNILKDKAVDSIFLKAFIDNMKKKLINILSKELVVKDKVINFFITSDEIIEKNLKIQEIFYDFYLNILMIFSQDNTLNNTYESIMKEKAEDVYKRILKLRNAEDRKADLCPEEAYFCYMFRKSFKYKVYFENFIKNFESLEIFKIPLLFGQEFIYIKIKDSNNDLSNRISLFKIIDSLYIPPSSQTIKITLNNIYYDYQDRLKKYFANFFTQERLNKMEQNQLINLDKKILTKYIYLLNNVYEKDDLDYFFPSIKIQETASIISINAKDVINSIKFHLEDNNMLDNRNYLIFSIVYVLCISLPLHSYLRTLELIETLSKSLTKLKYFMPHYVYVLMKTILKFYIIHKEQNIYPHFSVTNIKMFIFLLINLFRKNLFLPNEEMMEILKLFFGKLIIQERAVPSKNREEDDKKYFQIERNKNFYCFMKYNFSKKNFYSTNTLITYAMQEKKNCNINILSKNNKLMQPKIYIKINEFTYQSDLYTPKKIYRILQSTFNDFFKHEFDYKELKTKPVMECIVNLIQFANELNKTENFLPFNFLVFSLYFLKDFQNNKESK